MDALKFYELHLDELLEQTIFELNKNYNKLPPSKLRKFKSFKATTKQLSPLSIQISPHNCYNHQNCFPCSNHYCSHVPFQYTIHSHLPPLPPSPALIPIRIEPITPPCQPPTPLNDLDPLISSINDVD